MSKSKKDDLPESTRGRPRDPAIDERILDSALQLYGRTGWSGFSLESAARGARVSKDALYRRWRSREALLEDALKMRWNWLSGIDTGDIRADLLSLAHHTFDTFAGGLGEVALQLRADTRQFPELRSLMEPYSASLVLQSRKIIRRAIERGDLPRAIGPGLVMDLIIGGIINHIVSTPDDLRARMLEDRDSFLSKMVMVVLQGAVALESAKT